MLNYLRWLKNNYKLLKQYKALPKGFQRADGYYPSETYFKYPPDHNFGGKIVLNFGCGKTVYRVPNVINMDCVPGDGINVWGTEKTLPFKDESFDLIVANHVLEHVPDWFETFKEFARILKPGGRIEVWIPPVSSFSAFTFRDHINRIGLRSFDGIGQNANGGANALAGKEFSEFTHLKRIYLVGHTKRLANKWWLLFAPQSLATWMADHLWNTVSEESYFFEKV